MVPTWILVVVAASCACDSLVVTDATDTSIMHDSLIVTEAAAFMQYSARSVPRSKGRALPVDVPANEPERTSDAEAGGGAGHGVPAAAGNSTPGLPVPAAAASASAASLPGKAPGRVVASISNVMPAANGSGSSSLPGGVPGNESGEGAGLPSLFTGVKWSNWPAGSLKDVQFLWTHGGAAAGGPMDDTMGWKAWAMLAILIVMMVTLILGVRPPEVIMLAALVIVWNLRIIGTWDALAGFGNESLIAVGALFIVVRAVEQSKWIGIVTREALGEDSSQGTALARLCLVGYSVGTVVTNTPLVALLMPIVRDWARSRDFSPSKFLLPLAYSTSGSALLTIIGSSSNLLIEGMLKEQTGEHFSFFDPARVGVFANLAGFAFLMTAGSHLLPDNQGGLFRTLKARKQDMVTELQFSSSCPLVGMGIKKAVEKIGLPQEALLKVFRQPRGPLKSSSFANLVEVTRSPSETPPTPIPEAFATGLSSRTGRRGRASTENVEDVLKPRYRGRTEHCWGNMEPAPPSGTGRSKAKSRARAATDTPKYGGDDDLSDLRDPDVREICPVPDFENLEGGDVLLLSLPQKDCVAFVESSHVAELFGSMQTPGAGATEAAGCLRICDIDLLDIPGRENEYVELVVSYSNPFVGKDFDGPSRLAFEQHYQVNILAFRQVKAMPMTKGGPEHDQLPSLFAHRRNQAFSSAVASDRLPKSTPRRSSGLIPLEVEQLSAGDTLLVLARTGESLQQLLDSRDFLVTTTVAHEPAERAGAFEWVPLAMFLVCVMLVAFGLISLVRAAVLMAAVFLVFGFVNPQELPNCVDWRMLILIGSALGIARAVKVSGLSGAAASSIRKTHLGPHGTVFALFGFVMILTEVVTSNAAAAVGFPLALDLTNEMNLTSVKPLVMCVMLAASVAFTVPYACTGNLIVMGPGGYSFKDFAKIGLPMDLIYWLVCSLLLPIMWPMVTKEELGAG